ncbi:MAG: hypothetical protein MZV65_36555 [Chromatiales bacterium]|nr:hypothetical protein [Chromatiales bacterium]
MQTFVEPYNPAFSGEIRVPLASIAADADERAQDHRPPRRAGADAPTAWSTSASACPKAWPRVAAEEKIIDLLTLTAEPGVIGGIPAGGLNFGAAVNTQAIIDQPYQFDFYDGGGLDLAFLGLAAGRPRRATSTSAKLRPAARRRRRLHQHLARTRKKVVFVGTFTAGDLEMRGRATASCASCSEGGARKFVREVEHRTFSGAQAASAASRCSTSPSAACSG